VSEFWALSLRVLEGIEVQELYIRKAVSSIILERLSYGAC
jgi:hypothetical protein